MKVILKMKFQPVIQKALIGARLLTFALGGVGFLLSPSLLMATICQESAALS